MKKTIFILALLVSINAIAQRGEKGERIKALKVAFITKQLNLTAKESQDFWPIYNAYEKETHAIRFKEIRGIKKEFKANLETMSDADASTLIKRLNTAESKMHKLRIELSEKLTGIIPAKKIIRLKIAEDDFRRKMLKELQKRKRERP